MISARAGADVDVPGFSVQAAPDPTAEPHISMSIIRRITPIILALGLLGTAAAQEAKL
ncbi:MAG: hypothetical protein RLZ97_567, partial [Verrucomicrobiota bacterium]